MRHYSGYWTGALRPSELGSTITARGVRPSQHGRSHGGARLTMTPSHKKPGVAFWATVVVVVVLVAYPLSFGLACWWFSPPWSDGPWLIRTSDAWPHAFWSIFDKPSKRPIHSR